MTVRSVSMIAALAIVGGVTSASPARVVSIRVEPQAQTLAGAEASQQLLVEADFSDGTEKDVTDQAAWQLSDPSLARMAAARLFAQADGKLTVTATWQRHSAKASVHIERSHTPRPFSFGRDIAGIFTRRGCNSIACHGSVKGRGGFKLSALALNPSQDYEWITKGGAYQVLTDAPAGARVPRINLQDPAKSLLLLKPSMTVLHGGGLRLPKDSEDYRIILDWVRHGVP